VIIFLSTSAAFTTKMLIDYRLTGCYSLAVMRHLNTLFAVLAADRKRITHATTRLWPFGWDTRVVPSNVVLDRDPALHGKEIFGVGNPVKICITNSGQTVTDSGMVYTMDSL